MATEAEPFTEQTYQARKRGLQNDLAVAEQRHSEAARRLHRGEISEDEAARIAQEPEVVRMRLKGLEVAWAEEQRLQAAQDADRREDERKAAAKRVSSEEKAMEKAFVALIEEIDALEPYVDAYLAARDAILNEAARNRDLFRDPHDLGEFGREMRDTQKESWLVQGRLYGAGLHIFGVGAHHVWLETRGTEPEVGLAFKRNPIARLRDRLSAGEV